MCTGKNLFILKKIKNLNFFLFRLRYRLNDSTAIFTKKIIIFHNKKIVLHGSLLKTFFLIKKIKVLNSFITNKSFNFKIVRCLNLKKKIFLKYIKSKARLRKSVTFGLKRSNGFARLTLYRALLSAVFLVGKKSFWHKSLILALEVLSFSFKYSIYTILAKVFIRLYTRVELKKIVFRKRSTYIPYFIKIHRSIFLALKWIFLSIFKNVSTVSQKNKIYIEISQILLLKSCFSVLKLKENNSNSFNNRSNIHYRWQKTR